MIFFIFVIGGIVATLGLVAMILFLFHLLLRNTSIYSGPWPVLITLLLFLFVFFAVLHRESIDAERVDSVVVFPAFGLTMVGSTLLWRKIRRGKNHE